MNGQITSSDKTKIDTKLDMSQLVKVSNVYVNASQEVIVTTEDKVRLYLSEHLKQIEKKRNWITPLGIFLTIILTLLTSEFKPIKFGLSADVWQAIFILASVISFIWLIYSLYQAWKSEKIEDIVLKLKKGSYLNTKSGGQVNNTTVEISTKEKKGIVKVDTVKRRADRILSIWNARRVYGGVSWTVGSGENETGYNVPSPPGNFVFYYIGSKTSIDYSLVISAHDQDFDLESDLADIRVMVSQYQNAGDMIFKFVIATDFDLSKDKVKINEFFKNALQKVKEQEHFKIEVWDKEEMLKIENELGLKM